MIKLSRVSAILGLLLCGCPTTAHVAGGSTAGGGAEETTGGDSGTSETGGDGDVVENHRTYFIGESLVFDGGGSCDNVALNPVTSSLREELDAAGWTGLRFVDDNSSPDDYTEATLRDHGLDDMFGDAARLSVYSGHAGTGQLQWGSPSDGGLCRLTVSSDARLGRLAGDTAAATMFLASCMMRVDLLWPNYKDQSSRQFFGYHDSPVIVGNQPRKVFLRSADGQPTADAWLEQMVQNIAGKHSPVVLTLGTSPDDASDTHRLTNIASGEGLLENVGEPVTNLRYEMFDSGCDEVCGNCDGSSNGPLPELMLSAPVARATLARPVRPAAEIVERAVALLEVFGPSPLEPEALARLETWAAQAVERGSVAYAQVLDTPRVDISYEPSTDLLRLTDRNALARARPGPEEPFDSGELEPALRAQAETVHSSLGSLLDASVLLGSELGLATRALGYASSEQPQAEPFAFEYIYTSTGQHSGLALPDYSVDVGITRLGELSSVTLSLVGIQPNDELVYQRSPQQALDALRDKVLAEHPAALGVDFVEAQIGYQLLEAEQSAQLDPSLLVSYILHYGPADEPIASRPVPVRVSLVAADVVIERLLAVDPNPQPGDSRD